ncbi:MAG: molybdopterin molybdotransferase MoeA [Deltaproteobacteria bacterium]|nr:molybdopterin molybdotransferase MoeA [Deltaproteobacteria bacterium]
MKRSCDYLMLSFEDAWRRIAAALAPLPPVRRRSALVSGLVLAEEIIARENMPSFVAASMDGYAVLSSDDSSERSITGEQDAGLKLDLAVTKGTAVRIMTGAPLPAGADAVIPFEETVEAAGVVRLLSAAEPGANVRPVGQDIAAGEIALPKGSVLGPAEIGLLAALGHSEVSVHPRPRVSIMVTGNELVAVDEIPKPGQIRDSNAPALFSAATACGFDAVALPHPIGDDACKLEQSLVEALAVSDMLVTSGGVSMGTLDLIKPLLAGLGEVLVGRVAIKPGKPLTFAMVQGKPVFGLPGFPVSSLVCFELFARPALRLLSGLRLLWRPCVEVRLAQTLRHDPDRTEFQRAIVETDPYGFTARSTGSQSSSRLKSLVGANALLILPVGMGDFPAGSRVMAFLINQPEALADLPLPIPVSIR